MSTEQMKPRRRQQKAHSRPRRFFLVFQLIWSNPAKALASKLNRVGAIVSLQTPHPPRSPLDALHDLAIDYSGELNLSTEESWDVYGDFDRTKDTSYIRRFEAELAEELGMDDAVFMPSGVMAQSIALKIHSKGKESPTFMCHATSHLLLHEADAYREVCGMNAIKLPIGDSGRGFNAKPLSLEDIQTAFETVDRKSLTTLILELPHRELGGKVTSFEDILAMRALTRKNGVYFHCDGARIFEATTGYAKSPAELASQFDSVYISFYKGLGGMSGAMLLGSQSFCEEARVWLRRMGGNLYTHLPNAISSWSGYRHHWKNPETRNNNESMASNVLTFQQKKEKLSRIIKALSADATVSKIVSFDPTAPEVTMIHGYLKCGSDVIENAKAKVEKKLGVSVIHRWREINSADDDLVAHSLGYRAKFELSMGENNGKVEDTLWIEAWQEFAKAVTDQ